MTAMQRLACLFLFGLAFLFLAATATAAERLGDVEISVQPPPNRDNRSGTNGTSHGYIEVRVLLRNLSASDHTVHLYYPPLDVAYRNSGGVSVSRRVDVAAGQQMSVSLFQPPLDVQGPQLEVRVDGVSENRLLPCDSPRGWRSYSPYGSSQEGRAILLSRSVPQEFRDRPEWNPAAPGSGPTMGPGMMGSGPAGPSGGPSPGGGPSPVADCAFLRSDVDADQWTPNWLGYSCYDAVLLTAEEFEGMAPPLQAALRRYAECGGEVLVHGRRVPAVLSEGGQWDQTPEAGGAWTGYYVGLGHVAASGSSNWDAAARLVEKTVAVTPVYKPEEKPHDSYGLLIGEASVPVKGLFVLVLLFTIGIGPVNIWVLSRYRKRIWLWWNVPAVSLLTCLAVFCYALLAEGWTPRGKIASLTVLDERAHRATTIGLVSYYCPLTPSGGLRFGFDTDVAPLVTEAQGGNTGGGYSYYSRRTSGYRNELSGLRFVDWDRDQHLSSGWVTARVPAYFQVRKSEDRRERLLVRKDAQGNISVSNALGTDIRRLLLADASGRVFQAHDIPADGSKTLEAVPGARPSALGLAGLRPTFLAGSNTWLNAFRSYAGDDTYGSGNLGGNLSYIAVLAKSPFMDAPLAGADCQDTAAIVYGINQEQGDGR